MPKVERSSDVIEVHSEQAISYAFAGLVPAAIGGLLYHYRGESRMFVPLADILMLIGFGLCAYAVYTAFKIRKVAALSLTCPYCQQSNELVATPEEDVRCTGCQRMIPIQDGQPLAVQQVRCGYCNELNYYSDKTDVLLCESCNHEIPISRDDDRPTRKLPSTYAVVDDDQLYELILISHGQKTEELITCLQHMLALNRSQVKQILSELPVTLLTGITRKKAEMLRAQLSIHDGMAEFKALPSVETSSR